MKLRLLFLFVTSALALADDLVIFTSLQDFSEEMKKNCDRFNIAQQQLADAFAKWQVLRGNIVSANGHRKEKELRQWRIVQAKWDNLNSIVSEWREVERKWRKFEDNISKTTQ